MVLTADDARLPEGMITSAIRFPLKTAPRVDSRPQPLTTGSPPMHS
jgi:hypothetical protein